MSQYSAVAENQSIPGGSKIHLVLTTTALPGLASERDTIFGYMKKVPGLSMVSFSEKWATIFLPGKTDWDVEAVATIDQQAGDIRSAVVSTIDQNKSWYEGEPSVVSSIEVWQSTPITDIAHAGQISLIAISVIVAVVAFSAWKLGLFDAFSGVFKKGN